MNKSTVVILGGGPAGCATALALLKNEISDVHVIEAGHYKEARIGETIPPDTRLLFNHLGIWKDFLNENHDTCLGSCSSWGQDELGYNDFLLNPNGTGWHLDRQRFDRFLAQKVREQGINFTIGSTIDGFEKCEDGFLVAMGEEMTHTHFVVDATGPRAVFARKQGAKRKFHDRLMCSIGFFEGEAITKLTMLEAVAYGWWYAAKLPNNRVVVAAASDPDISKKMGLNTQPSWLMHLSQTQHISQAVKNHAFIKHSLITRVAPSFLLNKVWGANWLAVGDAASSYDPISSQGIYKAFSGGIEAAKAIKKALRGKTNHLDLYQDHIQTAFKDYLFNRNYFYNLENRWTNTSFWKRRRQNTHLPINEQKPEY